MAIYRADVDRVRPVAWGKRRYLGPAVTKKRPRACHGRFFFRLVGDRRPIALVGARRSVALWADG